MLHSFTLRQQLQTARQGFLILINCFVNSNYEKTFEAVWFQYYFLDATFTGSNILCSLVTYCLILIMHHSGDCQLMGSVPGLSVVSNNLGSLWQVVHTLVPLLPITVF